jgi:DNA polymerase-3 subunit delta'
LKKGLDRRVSLAFADLLGQPEAVDQLQYALKDKETGVHHAWLFVGPPGSGRSNTARAFAQALICKKDGCGECKDCQLIATGNHPDLSILSTDKVVITIEEVRNLVASSSLGSSTGGYRVLLIEDADRMAERSSNVLLKALEEPPEKTVWLLCAPSEMDMLPTIRSRVRKLNLTVPSVQEVANLLVEKEGVEPELAMNAARESQSHIGMARRLTKSFDARSRRDESLEIALEVSDLGKAMIAAERWLELAKKDGESLAAEEAEQEKSALMASLGLKPEDKIPPQLRSELKNLTENQKRKETRAVRDGLDRILLDLASLYRDISRVQLHASGELINERLRDAIELRARASSKEQTLKVLDEIKLARKRIEKNVRDLLVLEALATSMIFRGWGH